MLGFVPSTPLSLYSIPAVYFTAFYPSNLKFLSIHGTVGYDNVTPRGNVGKLGENKSLSREFVGKVQRMEGAHLNGVENFPVWSVAIIMGNMAGLDHGYLNKMALVYVATRILYNQIYINQTKNSTGWIRTLTFFVSTSLPLTIMIKAANKMAAA